MTREYTFTGDRNYAIRVCSDDEAEAWDEALRQEGVERERNRIVERIAGLQTLRCPCHLCGGRATFDCAAVTAAIMGEE